MDAKMARPTSVPKAPSHGVLIGGGSQMGSAPANTLATAIVSRIVTLTLLGSAMILREAPNPSRYQSSFPANKAIRAQSCMTSTSFREEVATVPLRGCASSPLGGFAQLGS